MKLTFKQKVRRDCLPQFFQKKFDYVNSLLHFIDPDYELFCYEEAVKIAQLGRQLDYYDHIERGVVKIPNISKIHNIQSIMRSVYLSNDYLKSFECK
jgi:hypothetical protein